MPSSGRRGALTKARTRMRSRTREAKLRGPHSSLLAFRTPFVNKAVGIRRRFLQFSLAYERRHDLLMVSQVMAKHRSFPERRELFCAVGFKLRDALLGAFEAQAVFFAFTQ